jgi:sRNA-binding regulator protein Hfq
MNNAPKARIVWSHDYVLRKHIGKQIGLLLPNGTELRAILINADKYSVFARLESGREVIFQKHALDGFNLSEAIESEVE